MSKYPFRWDNWSVLLRAIRQHHGHRAVARELMLRSLLLGLNKRAWESEPDAPLPKVSPIMIVGHQRSGTTWLHRLLAGHHTATSMALHTMALPSDRWQHRFDRPRPAWFDALQDRLLSPMDELHRVRLHEPEEEGFVNWPVVQSPTNVLDRPWPAGQMPMLTIDERAMAFHAQVTARQHRRTGRRPVGKNPHFSYRVPALRRALPNVKVIALWRDPAQCIPSRLSLIEEVWRRRIKGFKKMAPHHIDEVVQSSKKIYLGAMGVADLNIRYQDLVTEPLRTVQHIHEQLDLDPLTKDDEARIQTTQRTGKTRHNYSLERFGLKAEAFDDLREQAKGWLAPKDV